ncbi:CAP domain-containing protein [Streptomyces sp. NPDC006208]|uniref:CAP domain-containing protein n=1 Tax=Streptomyces sp. NPDC006208 TaxID=3156734 RepID=UPI0033B41E57
MRRRDEKPSKEQVGRRRRAGARAAVPAAGVAAAVITGMLLWSSARDGTPRPSALPSLRTLDGGTVVPTQAARPTLRAGGEVTTAPTPAPVPAPVPEDEVDEVVDLVNARRAEVGCPPVRRNGRLERSATAHADDMATRHYYGHHSPEGRDAGDRISAAGYGWQKWGENIYRGPKSPAEAMEGWMNSTGHRQIILDCSFTEIGVGVSPGKRPAWVQNFGKRN